MLKTNFVMCLVFFFFLFCRGVMVTSALDPSHSMDGRTQNFVGLFSLAGTFLLSDLFR